MKKFYGVLGAAALLTLSACSSDRFDGPNNPALGDVQGDLVLTLNVSMASQVGTRTATPDQGYEIGKDRENKITSAIIILADGDETNGYTVKFVSSNIPSSGIGTETAGEAIGGEHSGTTGTIGTTVENITPDVTHANQYKASFTFDRETLLNDVLEGQDATENDKVNHEGATKKKKYTVFVVANPTAKIVEDLNAVIDQAGKLQQVFESTTNDEYWRDNRFLMTSAYPAEKEIFDSEIAAGTHTTKETAYNLGTVIIQRAMSRFDLDVDSANTSFEGGELQSDIRVQFDAVAMVNMAKSAYLFKVMGLDQATLGSVNPPLHFADERNASFSEWWVATPDQGVEKDSYFSQLFPEMTGDAPDLKLKDQTSMAALQSFFNEGADFQVFSESWEEDNTYEHEGHTPSNDIGSYRIWRYCMENTNPWDAKNQVNGNTTGVIFRAILTNSESSTKRIIPTSYATSDTDKKGEALYAFGNVIIGNAQQLFEYATNNKAADDNNGVYEALSPAYWNIIQEKYLENWDKNKDEGKGGYTQTGDNDWWVEYEDIQDPLEPGQATPGGVRKIKYHHGNLSDLDEDLVAAGFSIYRPTKVGQSGQERPVYYCYYLYWNRHNDNGKNTIMGNMEFATVRNNVYKLKVTKVLHLGHPGEPGDDPYPPTPDTPDEQDIFWLDVNCQVLPWEVRINEVEF